ncbi:MAG: prepilin-type N-terminal cleavage/methylation domain-containing protein [Pirellulaceae bacterium]
MNQYQIRRLPAIRGFTFIELMVAIAVLAILLTLAVPSVQKIIRDSRVSSQKNEVIALINLTRNQAIRRGIDAGDTVTVAGVEEPLEARLRLDASTSPVGWSGNVSVTGGDTAQGCPSDVIRCSDNVNVELATGSTVLSFESRGYLDPFEETFICLKHTGENCTGKRQHVEIHVLRSGQIQTSNLACDETCGGTEG